MKRPVIVQVIPTLGGGGAEREVARVSSVLNEHGDFEIVVYCPMGRGSFADVVEKAGVEVVVEHEGKRPSHIMARDMIRFLRNRKPAIAHSHLLRWGPTVAKIAGVPAAIMTEHGWSPKRGRVGVIWDRANIAFADRVVAVSEATREIRIKKWKTPAHKVVTIPNAVEVDAPLSAQEVTEKKISLGLPLDVPVAGIIGRLHPIKGHEYFIKAAELALKQRPDCHFIIAGDGPCKEELEAAICSAGLTERVHMLGFRDDVREIIQTLDVACLSSLSEGTPITILEAMAYAKPAVVTRVGGCPEVVLDGITGIVAPPCDPSSLSDAILQVINDPTMALRMGEAGLQRVQNEYSVEKNLSRLIDLYNTVLAEKHI